MIAEFDVSNHRTLISNHRTLRGGEYARVKLQLQPPVSTFWLHSSSIVNTQAGVFVVRLYGIIEGAPVIFEGRNAEKLEIFDGFITLDNIVKTSSEELTEGSKASIK